MKRQVALILVVGLVFGLLAGPALAKKKKKKKPVPVDLTYYVVWNGDACALSVTQEMASEEDACADPFAGITGDALGTGPFLMAALDGVPLTLDAAKPVKGKLSVQSWYATGEIPDVMGIGQAQIEVKLSGTSDGEEVVIGELITEPYTVTPASADYVVEFEIQPAPELAGKVLDDLTLSLEASGNQMFHGVFPADGTSTLTMGAFSLP